MAVGATMLATSISAVPVNAASIPQSLSAQKTISQANPSVYIPSLKNIDVLNVKGSTLSATQLADAGFVLAMYRDYNRINAIFADYISVHGAQNFKQAMNIFDNKVDQAENRYGEYYNFAVSIFGSISAQVADDLFDDDIIEDDVSYYASYATTNNNKTVPINTSINTSTNTYYFDGDADEQAIYSWAKAKNLTTTNSVVAFNPDGWVTRDEVAVVIERAFNNGIFANRNKNSVSNYRDANAISSEFRSAVNSLQAMGIMKGDSNGNFRPKGFITELEAIILLSRAAGASISLSDVQYLDYARNTLGINAEWDDLHDRMDREEFFELIQAVAQRLGK